jgi:ATP synthase assembly factor FMC1
MSTPLNSRLRSLYRQLLREMPASSSLSAKSQRSSLHSRIRDSFASSTKNPSSSEVEAVDQFVAYLKAQRMYTTLIERYNPGMGMDEAERVRLTARKVGMNLPVEYEVEK